MADYCPHYARRQGSTALDPMELDQFPPTNEQSWQNGAAATTAWHEVGNNAWSGTLPFMPTQPMMPQPTANVQNTIYPDYSPHQFDQQMLNSALPHGMYVNPQNLQIPDLGRRFSHDSPFPQQTFRAANTLDDGTNHSIGVSEAPSDLFVYDLDFDWDLPEGYTEAMQSVQQFSNINGIHNVNLMPYPTTHATDTSPDAASPNAGKKPQKRLTDDQTTRLRNWFYLHLRNPYPEPEQMHQLQAETQLTIGQIRNWFARSRQRKLPNEVITQGTSTSMRHALARQMSFGSDRSLGRRRGSPSTAKGSVESLNCHRGTNAPRSNNGTAQSFATNPAEREPIRIQWVESDGKVNIVSWLNNVDDGNDQQKGHMQRPRAPTIVIDTSNLLIDNTVSAAIELHNHEAVLTISPTGLVPDYSDAGSEYAAPAPSRHSSCKSNSSIKSRRSLQSNHSGSSSAVRESRRGRRRVTNTSRSPSQASSIREYVEHEAVDITHGTGGALFYCELCPQTFTRRFTLNRHLDTIHCLEERPWICNMPNIGSIDMPQCCFCPLDRPVQVCPHRIDVCEDKSEEARSFWRRDHFVQHLEGVHKVSKELLQQQQIALDQWRAPPKRQELQSNTPAVVATDLAPKPVARIGTGDRISKALSSVSRRFKIGHGSASRKK